MLRFGRGDSARIISGAAVARATAALSAVLTVMTLALATGCTSGSSGGGATSPSPSRAASSAPDTLPQDATASLHGTATIVLGSSTPVTVAAGRGQPVTLELTPAGDATIDLSMRSGSSALFSLSGPARTGAAIRTDHVAILLAAAGVIVDSASGNPCQASYDVVSEKKVSGTVRCETLSGQQKVPVTVRFAVS